MIENIPHRPHALEMDRVPGVFFEIFAEAAGIFKTDIAHAERDHCVNQIIVGGNTHEGGGDQGDTMPYRKHGYVFDHVLERGQEKYDAEYGKRADKR